MTVQYRINQQKALIVRTGVLMTTGRGSSSKGANTTTKLLQYAKILHRLVLEDPISSATNAPRVCLNLGKFLNLFIFLLYLLFTNLLIYIYNNNMLSGLLNVHKPLIISHL